MRPCGYAAPPRRERAAIRELACIGERPAERLVAPRSESPTLPGTRVERGVGMRCDTSQIPIGAHRSVDDARGSCGRPGSAAPPSSSGSTSGATVTTLFFLFVFAAALARDLEQLLVRLLVLLRRLAGDHVDDAALEVRRRFLRAPTS